MEHEKILIDLDDDRMVSLQVREFDTDINTEELLQIDYSNILGDIITFPVLHNRIGLLKADIESIVATSKFNLEIYAAQLQEIKRKDLTTFKVDSKGVKTPSKPTVQEVENAVLLDEGYQLKKKSYIRRQRDLAYIESLYWSAKDKSDKLNRISEKLRPEEFSSEILEGEINGVLIKVRKKSF